MKLQVLWSTEIGGCVRERVAAWQFKGHVVAVLALEQIEFLEDAAEISEEQQDHHRGKNNKNGGSFQFQYLSPQ